MTFDGIGAQRLVDLAEVDAHRRRPPRPADARFAVAEDVRTDKAGRHRRSERQDRSGGVAAGTRDQLGASEVALVQLGKSEYGPREKRLRRVLLPVPLRVLARVFEPEVGAPVDDPGAPFEPGAGLGRR